MAKPSSGRTGYRVDHAAGQGSIGEGIENRASATRDLSGHEVRGPGGPNDAPGLLGLFPIHVVATLAAVGDVHERAQLRVTALSLGAGGRFLLEVGHLLGEVIPVAPNLRLRLTALHLGCEGLESHGGSE